MKHATLLRIQAQLDQGAAGLREWIEQNPGPTLSVRLALTGEHDRNEWLERIAGLCDRGIELIVFAAELQLCQLNLERLSQEGDSSCQPTPETNR